MAFRYCSKECQATDGPITRRTASLRNERHDVEAGRCWRRSMASEIQRQEKSRRRERKKGSGNARVFINLPNMAE
jgi:hypothetical protein